MTFVHSSFTDAEILRATEPLPGLHTRLLRERLTRRINQITTIRTLVHQIPECHCCPGVLSDVVQQINETLNDK